MLSSDGSTWTQVAYNAGIAAYPTAVTVSGSARYVRLKSRQTNVLDASEIQVFGPAYSPPSIANRSLWYDAAATGKLWQTSAKATQVAADGDPIGAWTDSHGGLDVLQANSSLRASLVHNALNGMPVVRFSGATDASLKSSSSLTATTGQTIFIVARDRGTTSSWGGLFAHAGCSGVLSWGSGAYVLDGSGASSANSANSTTPIANHWRLVTARYTTSNTQNSYIYFNGALEEYHSAGGVSYSATSNLIEVGSRTWGGLTTRVFKGDIAEILVYGRDLTAVERGQVEQYLAAKWNLL